MGQQSPIVVIHLSSAFIPHPPPPNQSDKQEQPNQNETGRNRSGLLGIPQAVLPCRQLRNVI